MTYLSSFQQLQEAGWLGLWGHTIQYIDWHSKKKKQVPYTECIFRSTAKEASVHAQPRQNKW